MFSVNQGKNEDDSQSNPHPEAGLLTSGQEDRHDMATGIQESPVGVLEGPIEVGGVCETEAGTDVDVEDEDEDVDVVGGVDESGVSGYESEGFTFSEIFRRKRIERL